MNLQNEKISLKKEYKMASELHTSRKSMLFLFLLLVGFLAFSFMVSGAGNSGTFQINGLPNAPQNPTCQGGINPTKIYTTTPTLAWTFNDSDSGDTQGGFNVIVGTSPGASDLWSYTTTSAVSSVVYAGSALSRGVTYHWEVRTNDTYEGTMGAFCSDQTFKINSLPTAAIVSPSNGATGQTLIPTLVWSFTDVDGDSQSDYSIQVSKYAAFNTTDVDQTATSSSTSYTISTPLTNATLYYWHVKVKDGNEWSDWQGTWNFTTTNITVKDLTTYNISYVKTSMFSPNQTVVIQYNVTNIDNFNNTYITITDPLGIKQVDHQGVASLQDNFTNANNWVPDIANRWNIVSGQYQHGQNGGSSQYGAYSLVNTSKLANQTNVTIQVSVDVDYSAEDMQRIIFRWTDANNYCAAYMSTVYSVIGIEEKIGGVRYREETSRLFSQATWYTIKVAVQGNTATVYSNGIPYVTKTLSTNSAGRIGLGTDTGWIYFDNYSVGYANSRVVGPITGGYQYEFNYTIPNNESLIGTWGITAYAESGGQVSNVTGSFDDVAGAPLIKNLTTYNATYVPTTVFVNGATVVIRTWVSDQYGIAGLTKCNITIRDPTGSTKVSGINMTDVGDITNGNIYEYNYTIPHSYDSNGIWNVTVIALNNRSNSTTKYSSFHDDIGSPNITSVNTYDQASGAKTMFALGDVIKIRATVTSINGRNDILQCNVTIKDQNGTYFVTNATMTKIGEVSNPDGNIYNYDYALPSSTINYGTWSITIRSNSQYYDTNKSTNFVLVWADTNYYRRQSITLQEKFAIDHTYEPLGLKVTLPSNVCSNSSTLKVVNEKGQTMPFVVQKNSGNDYWIDFVVNETASNTINYYIYYNVTGSAPSSFDSYNSTANNNMTVTQVNYTQLYYPSTSNMTYGKSIFVSDLNNDGGKQIILVGRNGPSGNNHGFLAIYNATYSTPTACTLNQIAYAEWNNSGANEAFCYGLNVTDLDNDGVKEIITGGTVYDGIRNKAQLIIWNFTGWTLKQEANSTWYGANYAGADNQTAIYNLIVNDTDGDGVQEILCAGTNGDNSGRGQFSVHNYTNGVIGHEFFYNYSLRTGDNNNNWTELYAISQGTLYSASSVNEIVLVGDTKDAAGKINGVLLVFRYSGGTWLPANGNPDWALNFLWQELTEFFSVSVGDIQADGVNELVTSGNQFDGVRDVAQYHVWNFTGPSYPSGVYNDLTSQNWYTYGYSSALTVKVADIDNDTITEITTVGFQNDGSVDRGDYKIRKWNGTNTITLHSELWSYELARRSGDFGDAAKIVDINNDGFNELIDTGRYALTPPTGTYIRVQTIGGIQQTMGAEDLLPPQSPSGASVTGQTETSISTSWTKGSDANNTYIRYSNSTYPTTISAGNLGYNDTGSSYTFEGLEKGTTYYFSLWSWRNGSSSSNYSQNYTTTFGSTKPEQPTIDAKTPTASSIQIDITKGRGASHTRIQRGDSGYPTNISDGTNVYNSTGTTTTDSSGLVHSHTYYYRAWSWNETYGLWSTNYGQDTETTLNIAPALTTNATTDVEETTATLHGMVSDDGGAAASTGFYYDTSSGGKTNNVTVAGTYTTGQSFNKAITSLTKGELYYTSAWGYNVGGFAMAGNEQLFLTKPDAPTSLGGSSGYNAVSSTWSEATCGLGENVGTRIQYQIGSAPASINEGSTGYNESSESTEINSLIPDTHYYFSAWAWVQGHAGGLFQWSDNYVTFDTWTKTSPPNTIVVSQTTGYRLNLSWSNGSGSRTIIIRNETGNGDYPINMTNGTLIYNGTGIYHLDTGLVSGMTYYYSFWSYNATLNQYSEAYGTGSQSVAILSLNISVQPGLIDFGAVSIPGSNWTTGLHFNLTNGGTDTNVEFSVGNTGNWTFVNISQRGNNKFCVNWSDNNWATEGNIEPAGTVVKWNLGSLQSWLFDIKVLTPTSISTLSNKEQFTLTITATPS